MGAISKQSTKKINIEFLRIIACFFVIFNHTEGKGFLLFTQYNNNSIKYWIYLFLSIFCKCSVPLFFAISGGLLLSKNESIKDVWKKRVIKFILVLIIFSFGYYLVSIHKDFSQFSLGFFFRTLYSTNHNYSYWYFYAFIPYLISLPLIRPLAQNMKNEHFLYMSVIGIIFMAVVPILEFLMWKGAYHINIDFNFNWITSFAVLYPCLGYYIENRMDVGRARKYIPLLWIINIVTIFISCYMTYYKLSFIKFNKMAHNQDFHSAFVFINMMTIYITIKCLFNTPISSKWTGIISSIGGATFGIYLVHLKVLTLLDGFHLIETIKDITHMNDMVVAYIFCLIVFVISYVLTLIMKKIPLLNQLV